MTSVWHEEGGCTVVLPAEHAATYYFTLGVAISAAAGQSFFKDGFESRVTELVDCASSTGLNGPLVIVMDQGQLNTFLLTTGLAVGAALRKSDKDKSSHEVAYSILRMLNAFMEGNPRFRQYEVPDVGGKEQTIRDFLAYCVEKRYNFIDLMRMNELVIGFIDGEKVHA